MADDTSKILEQALSETLKNNRKRDGEVVEAFSAIVEFAKGLKEYIEKKVTELEEKFDSYAAQLLETKKGFFESVNARVDKKLATIKNGKDGKDGVDGQDGENPDPRDVVPLVLERLPKILPETPVEIRKKLESLEGSNRLDMDAIDGLEEELERLSKLRGNRTTIFGGGMNLNQIKDLDISDQLDGVTSTFSIPAVWNVVSVALSSFPNALRKSIDFTYTTTSITFTSQIDPATSLAAGQTCVLTVVTTA